MYYVKNPKAYVKQLLELINEFSTIQWKSQLYF